MAVDQRLLVVALAQLAEQLAHTVAGLAGHAGGAKARHQLVRGSEEQHQVLSGGGPAVVQQHALDAVEATTAEQMQDGPHGRQRSVQLRTQCTSRGSDQPL